jgi:hypothetical protein
MAVDGESGSSSGGVVQTKRSHYVSKKMRQLFPNLSHDININIMPFLYPY